MSFFMILFTDTLCNDIKVFHIFRLRNFGDWSRWKRHQLKDLITLDRYIFRQRFLCVFGHVFDALSNGIKVFHICRLRNFSDWSRWERRELYRLITLDRYIFRHRFLGVFVTFFMLYPMVSKFSIFGNFEILVTGHPGNDPNVTPDNTGQVDF